MILCISGIFFTAPWLWPMNLPITFYRKSSLVPPPHVEDLVASRTWCKKMSCTKTEAPWLFASSVRCCNNSSEDCTEIIQTAAKLRKCGAAINPQNGCALLVNHPSWWIGMCLATSCNQKLTGMGNVPHDLDMAVIHRIRKIGKERQIIERERETETDTHTQDTYL